MYASAFREPRPAVAIVGAGAVGRVLALRLSERGYPIRGVISQTRASSEALARIVGAPVASDRLSDLPVDAALVAICVPDGQIADVAETLVGVRHPWKRTVVMHTSGALSASVLAPLAAEGASTLSFHPLQAITRGADASVLDGIYIGLEGESRARAAGIELVSALGLRYVVVSEEAKPRYHLAAAMTSNFVVTLFGMVQEVLASAGIDRSDAVAMMTPLLEGTIANLAASSPEDALTGPVARGDVETLRTHGLALRANLPHLVPAYAALSVETVRLAVRSGALSPDRAEAVLALMQQMVTTPLPVRASVAPDEAVPEAPAPSAPFVAEWAPGA